MTPLRSNFEPGTTRWAMRRAQWTALGLTPGDMEKPKIAIVNSSSDLASCFSHLDGIVGPLKEAIRAAGGIAFEVRTAAPSDAITSAGQAGQYILPSRDLIASDIEVAVEGALLDGMVCLSSCDKTTPAHLMAAGRLNIPTIIVACGYQPSGLYRGEHVDFEDVVLYAGHVATGKMTVSELAEMSTCAVAGPGVCAGMGTANSMHITAEVLGMALPGSTPVLANGPRMWQTVAEAGRRIVGLVDEDTRPRSILTPGAFRNAVTAVLAISGSVNTLKHLQAVAVEAGCDAAVYALFEELAPRVPLLAAVKPSGGRRIDEFEAAGGALGLLVRSSASGLFLVAAVYAAGYLQREDQGARADLFERGRFFVNEPEAVFVGSLLFFLAAMSLASIAHHFGLLWVAIEATTLTSAPLIYFHRHQRSLEATWKYLLICSVGIAVALLGTFFLIAAGYLAHRMALAQAMVITVIVIEVVVVVVAAGIILGFFRAHDSLNVRNTRNLKG